MFLIRFICCLNRSSYECLKTRLAIKQILSNFHPLEVVGRGSETQLHVGEK